MSVKRDLDTTEAEDNDKMIVDKTEGGMTQADDKEKMMVDKTEDMEVEETKGHKTEAKRKEVAKNMEVEGTKIAEGDKTEDMDFEETEGNKTVLTESDTQKLKSFTIALQKRSEAFDNNRSFDAMQLAKGTKDSLLPGLNIDSQVPVSKRKQDKQDKAMGWGDGHADKGAPDMDNADKGAPPSKGMWQGGGYVGKGKGDADTAGGTNMADIANMANTADEADNTSKFGLRELMFGETPESTESGDNAPDKDKAKYNYWTTDKYCPHCHKEVTIAIDTMGLAWFDKPSQPWFGHNDNTAQSSGDNTDTAADTAQSSGTAADTAQSSGE